MASSAADTLEARKAHFDRIVDFSSVVLISIATVMTAWCSYQSERWGALQAFSYNHAAALRTEAVGESDRANALETADLAMFLRWVATYDEKQTLEENFLFQRFRPEMKAAVIAWDKTKPLKNPHAPATPFDMPQYHLAATTQSAALNAQADSEVTRAQQANETADRYIGLTVIFAAVSFLAGISTKFLFPNHVYVIAGGFAMFIFGLIRTIGLAIR